mmetsp:Transcript_19408/g.37959  ORF Transcript_19408/g.37959 Transcript_19408/m.37959 type:complete len:324 (+) Transcript_19408:297-1268(+)
MPATTWRRTSPAMISSVSSSSTTPSVVITIRWILSIDSASVTATTWNLWRSIWRMATCKWLLTESLSSSSPGTTSPFASAITFHSASTVVWMRWTLLLLIFRLPTVVVGILVMLLVLLLSIILVTRVLMRRRREIMTTTSASTTNVSIISSIAAPFPMRWIRIGNTSLTIEFIVRMVWMPILPDSAATAMSAPIVESISAILRPLIPIHVPSIDISTRVMMSVMPMTTVTSRCVGIFILLRRRRGRNILWRRWWWWRRRYAHSTYTHARRWYVQVDVHCHTHVVVHPSHHSRRTCHPHSHPHPHSQPNPGSKASARLLLDETK